MNNQKGFSIIEVMIAASIMVIVALGVMQSIYTSVLGANAADIKNSLNALNGSLSQIATNQVSCTTAITKTQQTYGQMVRFDLPDGTVIAANQTVQNYPLTTGSFTFVNPILVETGSDQTKVYFGSLALSVSTTKKMLGPQVFVPRTIGSVYLTVNPAGMIVSCGSTLPVVQVAVQPTPTPVPSATPAPAVYDPSFDQACQAGGGVYNGVSCAYNQPSDGCGH